MLMSDAMRTGMRQSVALAASTCVLGLTFGALARGHGWGLAAPIVASVVLFSGSAQFALLGALAGGGAAWTAVASAALINLRFLPMALSAAPALHGGRTQRAVEAQAVVDGSWVLAHPANTGPNRRNQPLRHHPHEYCGSVTMAPSNYECRHQAPTASRAR